MKVESQNKINHRADTGQRHRFISAEWRNCLTAAGRNSVTAMTKSARLWGNTTESLSGVTQACIRCRSSSLTSIQQQYYYYFPHVSCVSSWPGHFGFRIRLTSKNKWIQKKSLCKCACSTRHSEWKNTRSKRTSIYLLVFLFDGNCVCTTFSVTGHLTAMWWR